MSRRAAPHLAAWRVDAIGAAICLVMCAGTYLISIRPLLARHDRFAQDRAKLASQREKAGETAALLQAMKKDLAKTREQLKAAPLKLQPAQLVNQRLAQLSGLAGEAGADVDDLQPGHIVAGTRYDTFPIHLAGTGTYTSCTALLHRIRQTFPDIGVNGLEITGRPTDPIGQAKFRFELVWYAAPAAHSIASIDTSIK